MQKAYLLELFELAQKDSDVVLLLADSGTSYDALIRDSLPNQVYDFGIGEENMVAAAAGMASCGQIPFVFTAGAFLAYRSMEFIRDDICLQKMNVKLIGMGTGPGWSTLGPTHHTTEDLTVRRAMPGLTILTPCDPVETEQCIRLAYEIAGPVYVRIGMGGEGTLVSEGHTVELGKLAVLRDGQDITIVAAGIVLKEVLQAAEQLGQEGISVKVVDACCIKPFDVAYFSQEQSRLIVTVEEHSITGGLGSAVLEALSDTGRAIPVLRIGMQDAFAKGYGTYDDMLALNGLDAPSLANKIREKWRQMNP